MIPTPEQLTAIAQIKAGNLQQVPFATLLYSLALNKRSVSIEIKRSQLEKKIVLDEGAPIDCRSNLAHETLGRFLVAENKLTDEVFSQCLSQAASKGVPLGEVLVEREVLKAVELFRYLQQNLAKKLLDCFTWREGAFEIKENAGEVDSSLKVKPAQLVVTGIMKFASQDDVNKAVVPLIGKPLLIHPASPFPLDEIKLPGPQTRLLASLPVEFRIDELAMGGQLPYEDITRLLYSLAAIGVVVRADVVSPAVRKQAAEPKPKPAAEKAAEATPAEATAATAAPAATLSAGYQEKLRNEIMQAYLSFKRQDPYDLFKLEVTASSSEIDEAYLRYSRQFNPWSLMGTDLENMMDKARELFFWGARGYAELANQGQRAELQERRQQKQEEHKKGLASGRFAIKTDLLDPAVQFKKGRVLMDAGKYREAVKLLEFAADCDAQNSIYRSELAYCKYLETPQVARESIDELKEAMRIDPSCGLAFMYAGEIYRKLDKKAEAEPLLRKACKLMAPDRRPVEALKTLLTAK